MLQVMIPQATGMQVTHAAKMGREDGVLHWHLPAKVVHDKVRAFVGWPGTTGTLILTNG